MKRLAAAFGAMVLMLAVPVAAQAQEIDRRALLAEMRGQIAEIRGMGLDDPSINEMLASLELVADDLEAELQAEAAQGQGTAQAPAQEVFAYQPRDNVLEGHPACEHYTVRNYQTRFQANSNGPDVQLHSLCAGAFNYYAMYLNAIRQGYAPDESNRTYDAFIGAATVATNFYRDTRGGTGF